MGVAFHQAGSVDNTQAESMERLLEIRAALENLHKMVRVKTHIVMKEWEM